MKKIALLTLLFFFVFHVDGYCFKKKKRKKSKTKITQTTKPDSQQNSVFVVSFISPGSGIDFRAVPVFEKQIKEFNASNHCNLVYDIKPWGREGEKDYCITSNDATCLKKYITTVKESFKGNDRIIFKENAKCRQ